MSDLFVVLRDTISGATIEVPPAAAERILAHPVWGRRNKVVSSPKKEVLAASYLVGEDGGREPVDGERPKPKPHKPVEKKEND